MRKHFSLSFGCNVDHFVLKPSIKSRQISTFSCQKKPNSISDMFYFCQYWKWSIFDVAMTSTLAVFRQKKTFYDMIGHCELCASAFCLLCLCLRACSKLWTETLANLLCFSFHFSTKTSSFWTSLASPKERTTACSVNCEGEIGPKKSKGPSLYYISKETGWVG